MDGAVCVSSVLSHDLQEARVEHTKPADEHGAWSQSLSIPQTSHVKDASLDLRTVSCGSIAC